MPQVYLYSGERKNEVSLCPLTLLGTGRASSAGCTGQVALLTRVKALFRWATAMEYTKCNPTLMPKAITPDDSETWPLTPKQFDELIAAT